MSCTKVLDVVKKLAQAMENGEYDFDGTQEKRVSITSYPSCARPVTLHWNSVSNGLLQPMPPVMNRAISVKQQMNDTEKMKSRLDDKDEMIRDLKTQLKLKVLNFLICGIQHNCPR